MGWGWDEIAILCGVDPTVPPVKNSLPCLLTCNKPWSILTRQATKTDKRIKSIFHKKSAFASAKQNLVISEPVAAFFIKV